VSGVFARLRGRLDAAGPVLALAAIVLLFAGASQVKTAYDDHALLAERAARRERAGLAAEAVPSRFELLLRSENHFLTANTFRMTANQTVTIAIAAMGMTMVIISGGIDLGVGSVIALTSVVTAWCLREGLPILPSVVAGILTGGVCGAVNALAITRLRVVPFIATLGMWGFARGLAKGIASEQKIDAPAGWLGTHVLVRVPDPPWLVVSPGVWTALAVAVLAWLVLRNTPLGRHIYAVGSSEAAARLCGVRVERTKVVLYTLAGLCAGLAGVLQFCRLTVGDPTTAIGTELDVIAAVVIGGGSLSGGEGSVIGSLLGALIMAFLRVGSDHVGIPSWVQEMLIGLVIVLAVAVDQWRRRRSAAGAGP
jgi:ribose transport system permease protein